MYELDDFERKLAYFGDRVEIIVALELGDKITSEEAYQRIKDLYKQLKKSRKKHSKTKDEDL